MKYLSLAALVLAAHFLYSCTDDEAAALGGDAAHGQIVAHIGEAATRTAVGDAVEGTNAVGIVWTDGDEIGVFDAGGAVQRRYAKVGSGQAATASFNAANPFANPVYAYYPYNSANDSRNARSLAGTLPATQPMDDGTLSGDYKIGNAVEQTDDGAEFEFRHLFSLARFVIDATGTPLEGETLKSLTMSVERDGAGVGIAGDFTFNALDGTWEQTGEGQSSISLTWNTQAPSLAQSYTCYMSLFPTIRRGDLFTITAKTDNYRAVLTAESLTGFEAEQIYTFPVTLKNYETLRVYGNDGAVVQGRFTCAALNVDGLPLVNNDGPGSSGTSTLGCIMNDLGYDFVAVSEDFAYHGELAGAMADYDAGTYRGSATNPLWKNDTDGLGFFWKRESVTAEDETIVEFTKSYGGLTGGANELIAKGFRHYVVTVATGVTVDVYITHMNTYDGEGNTEEENEWVSAQLSQLRQLRDYVLEQAKTNKRPAIIMGDTNMRYTRHQIVENLITPVTNAEEGFEIKDPWVELRRGGVYPTWNTKSLMIRSKFAGDNENDILCADDQRGEVVDKMWYINVPGASIRLKAVSCENNVDDFAKSTEEKHYSGVTVEYENGELSEDPQDVTITQVTGYADHFPVVVIFEYERQ